MCASKFIDLCVLGDLDGVKKMYNYCVGKSRMKLLLRKKQFAFDTAYKMDRKLIFITMMIYYLGLLVVFFVKNILNGYGIYRWKKKKMEEKELTLVSTIFLNLFIGIQM